MNRDHIAKADINIAAEPAVVWDALTDPDAVKAYMFGTEVETDWNEGSPITWSGDWKGKHYEDKGKVSKFEPERRLQYSHFSPLTGQPDRPENYHTVTIELSADGDRTQVVLTQDKNSTEDARKHSEENWNAMLKGLKKFVEH